MPFTRRELAEEGGVSERLIAEWVRLGILDSPERVGRRDGQRGAFYQWPDSQRALLLSVLEKRGQIRHTKGLVQIPIGIWLYWGDEWVPLRQIRRAVVTFTGLYGPPHSWEKAQANARQVVRTLKKRDAPRVALDALREELTSGFFHGKLNADVLQPLVEKVLRIDERTGGWSPFGYDATEMVRWIRGSVAAIADLGSFSDGDFYEARERIRDGILSYATQWRYFAQDPDYGQMFQPLTMEILVNRAGQDLIFALGLRRVGDEDCIVLPPVPLTDWKQPQLDLIPIT